MAIFLSASVPLPSRDLAFFATADVVAIRDAVKAFVQEFGPTHRIHFGGHPAITPLVSLMMERHPTVDSQHLYLYQSDFFRNVFPQENYKFVHQIYVEGVPNDRNRSLRLMRIKMLTDEPIQAAFFIGAMEGVLDEYDLVKELHPHVPCYPVASTGGASLKIFEQGDFDGSLKRQLTYRTLFREISRLLT